MLLLVVLIFIAAFAGVVLATVFGLRFAGRAMARKEPRRRLMTALALACALAIPGIAAAGFSAMAAVQFYASR